MNGHATKQRIRVLDSGMVYRSEPDADRPVAIGSRVVKYGINQLACTFMLQRAMGNNDFMPVISYSGDSGKTWTAPRLLWADHSENDSVFGSISPKPDSHGNLVFYGLRCHVDVPGESNWQSDNYGLKQNELCFSTSSDDGRTWSELTTIPKPTPGSVEAPGPICLMKAGRWLASYSVYNTFDRSLQTPHEELWSVMSDDHGKSWQAARMMKFGPHDGTAESWVVELSDGRLISACWHSSQVDGADFPTPFVISNDSGSTWTEPQTVGLKGQSIGLAAATKGQALLVYNQRREQPFGVRLAILSPDSNNKINVIADELIWRADRRRKQESGSDGLDNWKDFAFGEPSIHLISPDEALVVLWCNQPDRRGIVWIRVGL